MDQGVAATLFGIVRTACSAASVEHVRNLPTIAFCSKSCSVRLLCSVLILFELVGPDVLLHVLFGVGLGTVFCSMFCSGQRAFSVEFQFGPSHG